MSDAICSTEIIILYLFQDFCPELVVCMDNWIGTVDSCVYRTTVKMADGTKVVLEDKMAEDLLGVGHEKDVVRMMCAFKVLVSILHVEHFDLGFGRHQKRL